jgi:SAM-dependent methyltransferase
MYVGFDIVKDAVDWCTQHVTERFPNFQFNFADVYNRVYNPKGIQPASRYRFPYEDGQFNLVFATSVFTHMLPGDVTNYLAETNRVLKEGGRCFATFFILNDESSKLVQGGLASFNFKRTGQNFATVNESMPEAAVAYDQETVQALYSKNNFELRTPIRFGSWCGRSGGSDFQDELLAHKTVTSQPQ